MHDRARVRRLALLLALLVLAVFAPAVRGGFLLLDDTQLITGNAVVRQGLTAAGVRWAFTSVENANWFPVTRLAHLLDVQLFGLRPAGHHLASLLLHAAAAAALLLALARLTGRTGPAALAAAVFALHPLRAESVAWAAELKDVLAGLFFALALLAYRRWVARRRPRDYALLLAVFALGLGSKPMLVSLPIVLLLLDRWPLGRRDTPAALLAEKLPLALLAAGSSLLTLHAQRFAASVEPVPPAARAMNAALAVTSYLGKLLWPASLSPFYPHPGAAVDGPAAAVAAVALLVLSAAVLRARRRSPWLTVGWGWCLAMLLPVAGLVQVGHQAMADRYTYLPLVGAGIAISWEVDRRWPRGEWPRRAAAGAVALVLAAIALLTPVQVRRWRDTETLFTHALSVAPDNWFAHLKLGEAARERGDLGTALPHLERSVALEPANFHARTLLGVTLGELGRGGEAIAALGEAVRAAPGWADARHNLAVALAAAGRLEEAAEQLRAELRIDPGSARARERLAVLEAAIAARGGR